MDRVRLLREPAERDRGSVRSEEYFVVGVYEFLRTGRIKRKSLDVCCGKRKVETYAERHLLVEISRKTGYDLIRGRDVVKCHDLFFMEECRRSCCEMSIVVFLKNSSNFVKINKI